MACDLVCPPWGQGWSLLDSGAGRKLELLGGRLCDRPAPGALWRPRLPPARWQAAASVCKRRADGGGVWHHPAGGPPPLAASWRGPTGPALRLRLRLTSFGHCGIFPEHSPLWAWGQQAVVALAPVLGRPPRVAHLFGYTGAGSLALAAAGAEVFHVDSAKGVHPWGRESAELSGPLVGSVRWIHDDARSFLALSAKRGWRYDLLLADPPAWGHGVGEETWDFERDVPALIEALWAVAAPHQGAVVVTTHAPGTQRWGLQALLSQQAPARAQTGCADMGLAHADPADQRILPAGIAAWACWGGIPAPQTSSTAASVS